MSDDTWTYVLIVLNTLTKSTGVDFVAVSWVTTQKKYAFKLDCSRHKSLSYHTDQIVT